MPKDIQISTIDGLLDCTIKPGTTGKDLMSHVGKAVQVRELYFFGLQYIDDMGYDSWMRFDRKVLQHPIKKDFPLQLKFLLKYFPEDIENEISESNTLRLIYLQVKNEVMNDKLKFEKEDTVYLLASYVCQIKFGSFDATKNLDNESLVPKSIRNNSEKIAKLWQHHADMTQSQAMLEYLKTARNSEMFGKTFFNILKTPKGEQQLLGIDALGLNIYENNNNLTPKISVTWQQIRKIAYKGERITVKLSPLSSSPTAKLNDVNFYTDSRRRSKQIIGLCMGNLELYVRRRTGALQVTKYVEGIRSEVSSSAYEEGSDIDRAPDSNMFEEMCEKVAGDTEPDGVVPHREPGVPEAIPEETPEECKADEQPIANGVAHVDPQVPKKTEEKSYLGKMTDRMKQRFVSMCCFYTP